MCACEINTAILISVGLIALAAGAMIGMIGMHVYWTAIWTYKQERLRRYEWKCKNIRCFMKRCHSIVPNTSFFDRHSTQFEVISITKHYSTAAQHSCCLHFSKTSSNYAVITYKYFSQPSSAFASIKKTDDQSDICVLFDLQ